MKRIIDNAPLRTRRNRRKSGPSIDFVTANAVKSAEDGSMGEYVEEYAVLAVMITDDHLADILTLKPGQFTAIVIECIGHHDGYVLIRANPKRF